MKSAIRNAATLSRYKSPRHTNARLFYFLNPNPQNVVVGNPNPAWCHTLCGGKTHAPPQMEKQFESFQQHLEESDNVHDRIKGVATEIESTNRRIHSLLLLVHQSRPMSQVVDKVKGEIDVLKGLFSQLAEIIRGCPEQYYRFHGDWKSEMQVVISLLAFMHWLETDTLLEHVEAGQKLGLDKSEFRIDVADYLIGICFMSNELPRYVVNRVTAGDFDCPRKVMKFLTDLHAAFRMLNLRNDFLRKKFDSMKYDLRKVEEVYYDVKIRGLVVDGDLTAKGIEGQQ